MTPRLGLALLVLVLGGCAAPVGGWDSDALFSRYPGVRKIRLQRIGDLTPYPALVDGRVTLVACRFPTEVTGAIPIEVTGEDWPTSWGESALEAVDRALPPVAFERVTTLDRPGIRVRSLAEAEGRGPVGLGDTRAECDVSAGDETDTAVRGHIRHAEIRIRRRVVGTWNQNRAATAEGWIGAMLHELGHALGFQGHAVVGDSLVQLEQSRLRALGRRVMEGAPIPVPNVRALYALPPGTRLGEAGLSPAAEGVVSEVADAVAARIATDGPPVASVSVAGDHHARLVWRWRTGRPIVLRFPNWTESLRWGRPIEARRGEVARR